MFRIRSRHHLMKPWQIAEAEKKAVAIALLICIVPLFIGIGWQYGYDYRNDTFEYYMPVPLTIDTAIVPLNYTEYQLIHFDTFRNYTFEFPEQPSDNRTYFAASIHVSAIEGAGGTNATVVIGFKNDGITWHGSEVIVDALRFSRKESPTSNCAKVLEIINPSPNSTYYVMGYKFVTLFLLGYITNIDYISYPGLSESPLLLPGLIAVAYRRVGN